MAYSSPPRLAAVRNLKVKVTDKRRHDDNGVRGNIWDGVYSLWGSYVVGGVVHHLANEDSLANEVPSVLRMSDERLGYVAFRSEIVAVCTLNGIRK